MAKNDVFEKSENTYYSKSGEPRLPHTVKIHKISVPLITHDLILTTLSSTQTEGVLYRDVVRKYSWLEGLGEPISQEIADHLPYYYKLSSKNKAGHYQLVEAMHGRKLTSNHSLSTYILSPHNDASIKNTEWMERLRKIGKWAFYCDATGENVVEERAFEAEDTDAELVYTMIPVRTSTNSVTISYLDAWGYPADMNPNEDNVYGSVVVITYDENGYDSIIDYRDGQGYSKANTDGVDQRRYKYDDYGRVLQATSNNFLGDNTIDNWGNCGIRYYYGKDYYIVTYINAELTPMRLPDLRGRAEDTFISCKYILDEWGRKKEAIMMDENGNHDSTLSAIHRIVYKYDSDNMQKAEEYYDINGKQLTL